MPDWISRRNTWEVVLYTVLGCAALLAAVWILKELLPVLGLALGTFVGTAIAIVMHGAVTGGVIGAFATPAVAATGVLISYRVLVETVQKAKTNPFAWLLPVLALWAGAFTDLSKNFDGASEIQNSIYAILAGAATLVGAMMVSEKNFVLKALGFALTLVPPALFISLVLISHSQGKMAGSLSSVTPLAWLAVSILIATSILVAFLAQRASNRK